MRRYSDPIEVRAERETVLGPDGLPDDGDLQPRAFIWRGRLYVVRQVLAHWRERRAWWRDAFDAPDGPAAPTTAPSASPTGAVPSAIDVASREQHLWRVEASPGQAFPVGVFDITADGADDATRWRLVRVAD